jgi:hypothetical protein
VVQQSLSLCSQNIDLTCTIDTVPFPFVRVLNADYQNTGSLIDGNIWNKTRYRTKYSVSYYWMQLPSLIFALNIAQYYKFNVIVDADCISRKPQVVACTSFVQITLRFGNPSFIAYSLEWPHRMILIDLWPNFRPNPKFLCPLLSSILSSFQV